MKPQICQSPCHARRLKSSKSASSKLYSGLDEPHLNHPNLSLVLHFNYVINSNVT